MVIAIMTWYVLVLERQQGLHDQLPSASPRWAEGHREEPGRGVHREGQGGGGEHEASEDHQQWRVLETGPSRKLQRGEWLVVMVVDAFCLLIIELSGQVVTAEGFEEFTQDIVVLKSQIYSEAQIFNFTMKRIHESRKVTDIPWVFQTSGLVEPLKPTTSPSVQAPTTSLHFLTLVDIF